MTPDLRLVVAKRVHAIYMAEAKRQGDVRHHEDFDKLPANIQAFDLVLADSILPLLEVPVKTWPIGIQEDDMDERLWCTCVPDADWSRFLAARREWIGETHD